jgi:hypothetical protein
VGGAHVAAVVDAGPAGQLAQLRVQQVFELRQVGLRKDEVDALVLEHHCNQLIHGRLELRLAAHPEEQRLRCVRGGVQQQHCAWSQQLAQRHDSLLQKPTCADR